MGDGEECPPKGRIGRRSRTSLHHDFSFVPFVLGVVRHGDDLYVRSGYADRAAWYRGTQRRREGHIKAGGIDKEVHFENADPALNDAIDAVYRSKYLRHGAQWVDPMVAAEAHSTTIKLVPR